MSRVPRSRTVSTPWKAALAALLAVNLAFGAWALRMGSGEVTDGSGSVTTGYLVAWGIAATLGVVALLPLLPAPRPLVAQAMGLALLAQALHAGGHLTRLYYTLWFYDDLLHFGLVLVLGLVLFAFSRAQGFPFPARLGPARVGVLVWVSATAVAGLWEIFEFAMDVTLGTREQDDLFDTMLDIIDGTVGGALAGAYAARVLALERRAKRLRDARSDELLD